MRVLERPGMIERQTICVTSPKKEVSQMSSCVAFNVVHMVSQTMC